MLRVVCRATVKGPNVTAFRGHGGSVYLRCFVEFQNVVRTNAHVTWYSETNKKMPLVAATAMSATTKSPKCLSKSRRRRRRTTGDSRRIRAAGSATYKCRVTWDRSKPYIPEQVYQDFLTLATSKVRPTLELCVTTDPCAKSESIAQSHESIFFHDIMLSQQQKHQNIV